MDATAPQAQITDTADSGEEFDAAAESLTESESLVEEVSIDGMCGVY
ncbi:MAG TPA: mycofactocin precursor MftA [Spirillospora sp.]